MPKIAFVFPGQGSQYVGMGKDVYDKFPECREIFEQADRKLGHALSDLCFNGPEDELKLTINTQPAILTTSIALLRLLEEEGITPDYLAGHSLGEYSALVAARSLDFADAVWLVRQRGAFMQEAVLPGKGTMAAIIGLDSGKVRLLCREASEYGVVELANYNCPCQIVIAGETGAVNKAVERAKEIGAKKAVLLPVSGPFHSSLLKPASLCLKNELNRVKIDSPLIPVIANYTGAVETETEVIRYNLFRQVDNAVLWQQSVERMINLGVRTFIEVGPGKVLSGLIKKIDKNVEIYNIEDEKSLSLTVSSVKEAYTGCA